MNKLKFKKGFFLSSKGPFANVVNMVDEGNELIRFTGTSKSLIEDIYASTTDDLLLQKLATLHPEQDKKQLEAFLAKFLNDLTELELLDRT